MSNDVLPDTTNTFKALRYVQIEATKGHFEGHSTALMVLYYLVMNMWARQSGDQGPGEVMRNKSGIEAIAAATALSRSSVQRAIKWLAAEEWINTQRTLDDRGSEVSRYIYVKLDMPGHHERERLRAAKPAQLRLVGSSQGGCHSDTPRVAV
jgi:DNA-binding MarR family transcriptional regulator